jgi:hypothetical protein
MNKRIAVILLKMRRRRELADAIRSGRILNKRGSK